MQTNLTPSKKKRVRARRQPHPEWLNWQDEMNGHCQRLEALAEVLDVASPVLEPPVIAGVGQLAGREIRAMKALLEKLVALR
jgi:hypothetical protein